MFRRSKQDKDKPRQSQRKVTPKVIANPYSYHAVRQNRENDSQRRSEVNQDRIKNLSDKPHRIHFKTIILVIIFLIIFGFMTWLNNNPNIIILGTATEKELLQNPNVYHQAVIEMLQSSFTNHNKLTLNTENIANEVLQKFPELSNVSIQAPIVGFSPSIYMVPAIPVVLLNNGTNSDYVLSATGTAIAELSGLKGAELHLPLIDVQSNSQLRTGQSILSSNDIIFIQTVIAQLKAHSLIVSSLSILSGTSELDVRINSASYFIKFNLGDNADQQLGTFLAVHKDLLTNNITPSQYIDVRVLGRAFYK